MIIPTAIHRDSSAYVMQANSKFLKRLRLSAAGNLEARKVGRKTMLTVIETPFFSKLWPDYWTETERAEFAVYLAENPDAGNVIAGSGGCRKVRWNLSGTGKSGGVRVIYFNRLAQGCLMLLIMYAKSAQDTISADVLRKIAKEFGNPT